MDIANPIYDEVFKMLMSNARLAKFFIGAILGEDILEVEYQPQELPVNKVTGAVVPVLIVTVFRLDFVATIKTTDGEYKKILIEIQKTRRYTDIMRFRNYLGEHYKREDDVPPGSGQKKALPIITIYMLGFNLPGIKSVGIKVDRQYTDMDTRTIIREKEDFIELLTHDCYIIQMLRIEGKLQSPLQKLLTFFEQKYFRDETGMIKQYNYPISDEDEDMKLMANALHYACTDPDSRRLIEAEQETLRMLRIGAENMELEIEELKKEKVELKKENEQILKESEQILKENEQILKENEQILKDRDQILKESEQKEKENEQILRERDQILKESEQKQKENEQILKDREQIQMALFEKNKILSDQENLIAELKKALGL